MKRLAKVGLMPGMALPAGTVATMLSTTPIKDLSATVQSLKVASRQRAHLVRAEVRLSNQVWAITHPGGQLRVATRQGLADQGHGEDGDLADTDTHCSGVYTSPVVLILQEAQATIHAKRRLYERQIISLTQTLPVWGGWAEKIKGISALGLGLIVGAAVGDISNVLDAPNPAKLWKRMGLAVLDGRAQRRVSGRGNAAGAAQAIEHGFSPHRRAMIHMAGIGLRNQNKDPLGGDGPYRALYVQRKAYEAARLPEAKPIVHEKRALRYMEKRFLRDLWHAWRQTKESEA